MKKQSLVAKVVSRVFEPVVEIPLAVSMAVWFAVNHGFRWRFLLLLLLIDALMPFIFYLHLLRKGEVSNWDITERRERIPLYLFTLFAHGVGLAAAYLLDKGDLAKILLVFYVVALVFFGITLKWKISVHTGVNAVLVSFWNIMMGWQYWWLYGVVVLVGWARVRNGHHTWFQAVVGAALGGWGVYIGFALLNLV